MVGHLYDEGDRDIIFFGFIIGAVSFDREDAPYEKSEADRFNHALRLANFLISEGDFSPGKSIRRENSKFRKTLYEGGFEEFRQDVENLFDGGGIDNMDLVAGPWLSKIILVSLRQPFRTAFLNYLDDSIPDKPLTLPV
ncbi:hypothetical protein EHI42_17850 [Rhizobium hidalgonense]|uniref:hypothetical protein n=1 Tax=Rhizobium hidalgonense TaxID=1538159 RepID=UPI000FEC93EF|nr:hypothetical protein [Rhizobium hidalgonense]RWX14332.1 hypothetical protein EHI42_17850 [Rhizobium hidalgonense]